MPVTLESSESHCLIRLEGRADITNAAELKDLLLHALALEGELRVHVDELAEVDLCVLQLLWAGEREARTAGKRFQFDAELPDGIARMIANAGLTFAAATA